MQLTQYNVYNRSVNERMIANVKIKKIGSIDRKEKQNMGKPWILKKVLSLCSLAHIAETKFRQLHNLYRPGKLTLEQIFSRTVTREAVPSQMLNMAKKFKINERDIAQPNWRAVWIVENCNTCWAGEHCFRDHDSNPKEKPGIIAQRCPNFAIYQCIAAEKQTAEQEEQELEQYLMEQWNHN